MKRSEVLFGVIKIPLDVCAVVLALVIAYRLREANIDLLPGVQLLAPATTLPPFEDYVTFYASRGALLFVTIAAGLKLYMLRVTLSGWREVERIWLSALLWIALVIAWFSLVEQQLFFSRALLVHATVFIAILVTIERALLVGVQRSLLRRGVGVRRVVSFGAHPVPDSVERILLRDPRYAYAGHARSLASLKEFHASQVVDLVLHTDADPKSEATLALIDACRNEHIGYAFLPPLFSDVPHQLLIFRLGMVPILRFEPTPLDGWGRVSKRLFDLVAGTLFFLLLSPLLLLIAALILLTSGWPILYVSTRVGQHARRRIPVLKFRTMVRNADERKHELAHLSHRGDGPLFKVRSDPRVTPLGRVLRRFSFDELPQLFNVLAGHMSLVGPRPHLPDEVARYHATQRRVFAVKPGITGLAQISGRSDLSFDDEVRLDMRYVEEWSLLLDLWILWRTVFVVMKGRGAD